MIFAADQTIMVYVDTNIANCIFSLSEGINSRLFLYSVAAVPFKGPSQLSGVLHDNEREDLSSV